MSVEYRVKFNIFHSVCLEKLIESWEHNLSLNINFKCNDKLDRYIFFTYGSIRGVSVAAVKKNELNIRLNYYASSKDVEIACMFLKFLLKECSVRIFNEDGKKINEIKNAIIESDVISSNSISFFEALFSKEEYINLPLWDTDIVIYKHQFDEMKKSESFPENFNQYLQSKAYRIFMARRAAQIITEKETSISVWTFDDMILYSSQIIAIQLPTGESIFVKWEDFLNSRFVSSEAIPSGQKEDGFYYFISSIDEGQASKAIEDFRKNEIGIESL